MLWKILESCQLIFSEDRLLLPLTLYVVTTTARFALDFESFICLMAAAPEGKGGRCSREPGQAADLRRDSL